MNKFAMSAAAAVAATALTAAAMMPAAGGTKVYTKRLVSRDIASHSFGEKTFAGTAVDRHAGHIVGYDSYSGHFFPQQNRAVIWDSLALKNGTISLVVNFKGGASVFTGRILSGTGKYKGIDGTVTARPAANDGNKTFITLTYHF